jgi:hypothetical protein
MYIIKLKESTQRLVFVLLLVSTRVGILRQNTLCKYRKVIYTPLIRTETSIYICVWINNLWDEIY